MAAAAPPDLASFTGLPDRGLAPAPRHSIQSKTFAAVAVTQPDLPVNTKPGEGQTVIAIGPELGPFAIKPPATSVGYHLQLRHQPDPPSLTTKGALVRRCPGETTTSPRPLIANLPIWDCWTANASRSASSYNEGVSTVSALLQMIDQGEPPEAFLQLLHEARANGTSGDEIDELEGAIAAALQFRASLDDHYRRADGLSALYETAVDLTAMRDVEEVLRAIVRRARELLRSDTAYITLNDEDQGETYMRVSVGTVSPRFEQIRLPYGRGVGGVVASTGGPYYTNLYLDDERLQHQDEVDEIVQDEGLVAILGVPLLLTGRVIGVLFASDRRQRTYQPEEIHLLASLGALAAVALENARLFEDLEEAVSELNRVSARDHQHRRNEQWATEAHERLTRLVADGADVDALTAAVSESLQGSVMVLDGHGVVLGDLPNAIKAFPALDADRVIEMAFDQGTCRMQKDGHTFWVTPVIASGTPLGVLLIQREDLNALQQRTLERAAQITAGRILNEQAVAQVEQRVRSELLDSLLGTDARALDNARRRAALVGMDLELPHFVVIVAVEGIDLPAAVSAAGVWAARIAGVAGAHQGHLVLILPGEDPIGIANGFVQQLVEATDGTFTAATHGPTSDPADIPEAVAIARQCLNAMMVMGRRGEVAGSADLGFYRLLLANRDPTDVDTFVASAIGSVREYDNQRGTVLVETLAVYLQAQGNVTEAARILHVHANTLYKRLARLSDLLGPSWQEGDRRLQIELALALNKIGGRE